MAFMATVWGGKGGWLEATMMPVFFVWIRVEDKERVGTLDHVPRGGVRASWRVTRRWISYGFRLPNFWTGEGKKCKDSAFPVRRSGGPK